MTPDAGENALLLTNALSDLNRAHDLQFGDLTWQFNRQSFTGSKEAALTALREICRQNMPEGGRVEESPGPAERKLLDRFQHQKPVAEERGKWALYELEGTCPMVAVTRERTGSAGQENGTAQPNVLGPEKPEGIQTIQDPYVAPKGHRVVTWGLAVPTGKQTWNVYTFAAGRQDQEIESDLSGIRFPPDSMRILSLRVPGDGAMVSFQGNARPPEWQHFFDGWFQQCEWTSEIPWRCAGLSWHRRYTSGSEKPQRSVEVFFCHNNQGKLMGVLTVGKTKSQ